MIQRSLVLSNSRSMRFQSYRCLLNRVCTKASSNLWKLHLSLVQEFVQIVLVECTDDQRFSLPKKKEKFCSNSNRMVGNSDLIFVVRCLCWSNIIRRGRVKFNGNSFFIANTKHILIFSTSYFIADERSNSNVDKNRWFISTIVRRFSRILNSSRICWHLNYNLSLSTEMKKTKWKTKNDTRPFRSWSSNRISTRFQFHSILLLFFSSSLVRCFDLVNDI